MSLSTLRREDTRLHQWKLYTDALATEKESEYNCLCDWKDLTNTIIGSIHCSCEHPAPHLYSALQEEVSSLRREVKQLLAKLDEQQEMLQSKDKQVASLKSTQQLLMSSCSEKIKVGATASYPSPSLLPPSPSFPQSMEEKYQTVKVVNQQLESAILELRGRTGVSLLEKSLR